MNDSIQEENEMTPPEPEQNPHQQQQQEPKTQSMAETIEPQPHEPKKTEKMPTSFSIWPPTQRTREAVTNRLIETLSSPSVLSKRYGTIPRDEALAAARRIEDDAFATAAASASTDDDGIEILQVYSKEISKRMLDAVKSRSASASTPDNSNKNDVASESAAETPTVTPSEDISSVETES